MRALKIVTVAMGVLIVAGTVLLAVLILRRMTLAAGPGQDAVLHEPAGTRMAGLSATGQSLALLLQGGGPDRVVLLDPRTLRETGRLTLGPPRP